MAELKRVRERIAELAGRPKNVTIQEIEWVVNQLGTLGFKTHIRGTQHNKIFRVNGRIFSICSHNRGSKQIKSCYVKDFLDALIELGLYEE
jgi:hypothetical protein